MRSWKILLACGVMLFAAAAWPWNQHTCTITATPETIALGEKATLTCEGSQGYATLDGTEIALPYTVEVSPAETTTYTLIVQGQGRRWRDRWAVQDQATVTLKAPEPVPPEPLPPVPPPPQVGLLVLITGPGPRAVRDMSPEGVAVLTSRTVRDWTDKACEPGGFLIAPNSITKADPKFAQLASKAPEGRVTLVAKMPDKEPIVLDPIPAFDVVLAKLREYAGVKESPNAARAPSLREFTAAEWKQYVGQNGTTEVNGIKRFNSTKPRDLKKRPYGASLADSGVRVIPRSEWSKYLAAQKAANAGIRALLWDKLPSHDQASTNYCWANGPACCGSTLLYITGRGNYLLSAASVGGPVTGYRNVGGWPADAIAFMASTGAVRDILWPNASINRAYASKAEVKADYPKHLVSSTIADLGQSASRFDETVTCVLLGCPVATCHDWWGHAVTAVGIDYSDGVWYLEERNSWGMSYGQQGFFKLREGSGRNQAGPDDAQVILWLGDKKMGTDGASLNPFGRNVRSIIEVPVSVDVAPSDTCPNGNCGQGGLRLRHR